MICVQHGSTCTYITYSCCCVLAHSRRRFTIMLSLLVGFEQATNWHRSQATTKSKNLENGQLLNIDSVFSRPETDVRRKRKEHWRKKVYSCCKAFFFAVTRMRLIWLAEVESSRTSLASRTSSRTHFEVLGLGLEGQVLGLGLEASSPRKLACPRLEDSTIFWIVKILRSAWKIF